ncbi:hypothetical protein HK100_009148 [Physocladia obscura]|uniref:Uncharacterized protein n=1 Tax=Physocladia obscura TaxID=109957 RepID=A0AAD5T3H2_9FUNG|nr:hypothetical protein HK100_009148 [Physocladia obscura]
MTAKVTHINKKQVVPTKRKHEHQLKSHEYDSDSSDGVRVFISNRSLSASPPLELIQFDSTNSANNSNMPNEELQDTLGINFSHRTQNIVTLMAASPSYRILVDAFLHGGFTSIYDAKERLPKLLSLQNRETLEKSIMNKQKTTDNVADDTNIWTRGGMFFLIAVMSDPLEKDDGSGSSISKTLANYEKVVDWELLRFANRQDVVLQCTKNFWEVAPEIKPGFDSNLPNLVLPIFSTSSFGGDGVGDNDGGRRGGRGVIVTINAASNSSPSNALHQSAVNNFQEDDGVQIFKAAQSIETISVKLDTFFEKFEMHQRQCFERITSQGDTIQRRIQEIADIKRQSIEQSAWDRRDRVMGIDLSKFDGNALIYWKREQQKIMQGTQNES